MLKTAFYKTNPISVETPILQSTIYNLQYTIYNIQSPGPITRPVPMQQDAICRVSSGFLDATCPLMDHEELYNLVLLEFSVKFSVADCFCKVLGVDVLFAFEVGDGAGDFADFVVCAGAQCEFGHRLF